MNGMEDLRRLHQRIHRRRRSLGSQVNQEVVHERELALGLLGCVPIELIEQVCQLVCERIRDAFRRFFRRERGQRAACGTGKTGQRARERASR